MLRALNLSTMFGSAHRAFKMVRPLCIRHRPNLFPRQSCTLQLGTLHILIWVMVTSPTMGEVGQVILSRAAICILPRDGRLCTKVRIERENVASVQEGRRSFQSTWGRTYEGFPLVVGQGFQAYQDCLPLLRRIWSSLLFHLTDALDVFIQCKLCRVWIFSHESDKVACS